MLASFSNIFGSVVMRLVLIYGALTAMTAAAIAVGWIVFQSIAGNMQTLADYDLPDLQKSALVVSVADRFRDLLTDTLTARNTDDLDKLRTEKELILEDLRSAAAAFGDVRTDQLMKMIDDDTDDP